MRCLSSSNLHEQRGAIGLFGLLILLLAIMFTALAVDSGRLWMQQRKLQSIADIAAISASRQVGCSANATQVTAAAQTAAANNGFAGQLAQSPNQVALGRVTTTNGIRVFTDDGSTEAVFVRATQEVPSSLIAGGIFGNTVVLSAEAVSLSNSPIAAFSAGSFAANLDGEDAVLLNALLGDILGSPLNLSALSYQGIASTQINLRDIAVAAGVGTVEALLDADMQIADLLAVFASAAGTNAAADLQAVSDMQTIAGATVNQASLKLADIVTVSTPDADGAAVARLNALSLMTAAAIVANGENAIILPLAINVPSISSINAQLTFVEAPQLAVGPAAGDGAICTMVRTAQVRTRVGVLVSIPLLARIDLALTVELAQADAGLRSIAQEDDSTEVRIEAMPGIASLVLTNNAGSGPARISTLDLPPLLPSVPIADVALNLPLQPSAMQALDFTVDHPVDDHLPQTQTVASPLGESLAHALSDPDALDVTILSALNLGLVNNVVATIVSPLLGEIGRVVLDPLLKLLGMQVGGLDVTLEDLHHYQAKPLVI